MSIKNPWGDGRPKSDSERQAIAQRLSAYDSPSALQARQYRMPLGIDALPDMSSMVTSLDGVPLPSPSGYMKGVEVGEPGDQKWWQQGLEFATLGAVDLHDPVGSVKERDLTESEKAEIDRQWRTRQANDTAPLGQANLANRGQGRLRNFGMGTAYQPMMR